jgi:hypothetical protein
MASKPKTPSPSPSARAREFLLTLLTQSDEAGNTCSYDIWPYANAWHQLGANPDPDSTVSQWQPELKRLNDLHQKAISKYKGTLLREPVRQKLAAHQCLELKDKLDAGDSGAALDAIALCAVHGLVIPSWLAVAFVSRYHAVIYGDARDWNDERAFGRAFSKNVKKSGTSAKKQLAPWAYECAMGLLDADPDKPINWDFYDEVATEIGSSSSNVQRVIKNFLAENDFYIPLAQFKRYRTDGLSREQAIVAWDDKRSDELHKSIGAVITPIKAKRRMANHKMPKKN